MEKVIVIRNLESVSVQLERLELPVMKIVHLVIGVLVVRTFVSVSRSMDVIRKRAIADVLPDGLARSARTPVQSVAMVTSVPPSAAV